MWTGSAVAVAAELPDRLGAAVLDAAREAFVQAMHVSSAIAAVVGVGLAVLALVTLRDQPAATEEATGHPPAAKGVAMNAPEERPTERQTRSAEAKRLAVAVIGAGACIGVAAIAAALFLLF